MVFVVLLAILAAISFVVARAIAGPTVFDRVLAGNAIGTLVFLISITLVVLAQVFFIARVGKAPAKGGA